MRARGYYAFVFIYAGRVIALFKERSLCIYMTERMDILSDARRAMNFDGLVTLMMNL